LVPKEEKPSNTLAFIKEIAKYFMDFLETDFHKRRNPRRSWKLHNDDGLMVGLELQNYPDFERAVRKLLSKAFQKPLDVSKGEFRAPVPEGLLNLVRLQTQSLTTGVVEECLTKISIDVGQYIALGAEEYDQAVGSASEDAVAAIKESLVSPFLRSLDKPLKNLALGDDSVLFQMEQELTSVIFRQIEAKIGEIIRVSLAGGNIDVRKELIEAASLEQIQDALRSYFDGLKAGDLFLELFELSRNQRILDKQDFYLYFCDATFDNVRYPVFYLPLSLERDGDVFLIEFDARLFINKRALEFISQQHNEITNTSGGLQSIAERILYLSNHSDDLLARMDSVMKELASSFKLNSAVEISSHELSVSRGPHVRLSNRIAIALFDKSDEALVNDYEEILALDVASPLVKAFEGLVDDFIRKDPKVFTTEVEDEWEGRDTIDRLVFESPIPLNSEQLKIRSALQKEGCNYLVVEGPPGTGKSHTITAIVFDQLLKERSTLVLSDKKEALDVVEDKITEALNRVRPDKNFQNPILRLGKTGNTYAQILSKSSMDSINVQYRAVRHREEDLQRTIEKTIEQVSLLLDEECARGLEINIVDIVELTRLEHETEEIRRAIQVNELLGKKEGVEDLAELRESMADLPSSVVPGSSYDPAKLLTRNELEGAQILFASLTDISRNAEGLKFDCASPNVKAARTLSPEVRLAAGRAMKALNAICFEFIDLGNADPVVSKTMTANLGTLDSVRAFVDELFEVRGICRKAATVFKADKLGLHLFPDIKDSSLFELTKHLQSFQSLRLPIVGYLFKAAALSDANTEFRKSFPASAAEEPHRFTKQLTEIRKFISYLWELKGMAKLGSPPMDFVHLVRALAEKDSAVGKLWEKLDSIRDRLTISFKELDRLGVRHTLELRSFEDSQLLVRFLDLIDKCETFDSGSGKFSGRLRSGSIPPKFYDYLKEGGEASTVVSLIASECEFFGKILAVDEDVKFIAGWIKKYPLSAKSAGLEFGNLQTFFTNRLSALSDDQFESLLNCIALNQKIGQCFKEMPVTDYVARIRDVQQLLTVKMTYLLDRRLIEFYENNQRTAKVLREIIQKKQKFPKEEFGKLKSAFPCILAGIRDYAEYIPLEENLFDLVIIDEASQVSIAQAFPALLRAKKVVIFGDKKQFSNVKTAQARSDTNHEYLNRLKESFSAHISSEPARLVSLAKFNIKTSILEFFEFISNYHARLLKHFRGYKELISYSNRHFYKNTLQVMKIRGKAIGDVIRFTEIAKGEQSTPSNTNAAEAQRVMELLLDLKERGEFKSVGVITPHTNQQKLILQQVSKMPEADLFFNDLKLKIMTFDTCQGEEREIIIYSMVANSDSDRLIHVFISDLSQVDIEEEGMVKAQRLNVGFSRAKECMHFLVSKPVDEFNGSIGQALRHYKQILAEAAQERDVRETDPNSAMEPKVLNWLYQTEFWRNGKDRIEVRPQFALGTYLKQLDPSYSHPLFKVDFLLMVRDTKGEAVKIIIEYDGFEEHFKDAEGIDASNYAKYYSSYDQYREKVLESYGYRFVRINRFNVGDNPIATLDKRLTDVIRSSKREPASLIREIGETANNISNGDMRECNKCKELKALQEFFDKTLKRRYGRFCNSCKGVNGSNRNASAAPKVQGTPQKCPLCKSGLVLRTGRRGPFYGCERFPKCRGSARVTTTLVCY